MGEISIKKLHLELSTARVEALTDGVFAIAMTLLVLNLDVTVPIKGASPSELHDALGSLWPHFLHYVESFLLLSVFWIKNHQQFHFIRRCDQPLMWLSLLSLLFVCLLPFTTSLVSDYGNVPMAAIIFEVNLFAAGFVYYLQWRHATHGRRLVDASLDAKIIAAYRRTSLLTPIMSFAAIGLSFFSPRMGTGLYFLIPLILVIMRRW
jgi:uncharacterized membrane protein